MDLSYAEGWRPDEGDTLIGRVTDVSSGRSNYGAQARYPIVTVQPDEGPPVAVHCFHAALRARVTELRPAVGERIGIKFVGKREHKTDPTLTVADYIVKVEGRSADVWAQMDDGATTQRATDVPVNPGDFAPSASQNDAGDDDIPF